MRSEEELAELTKLAQQLEEELDRLQLPSIFWRLFYHSFSETSHPRTREELGATTHQLAEKEGFAIKYIVSEFPTWK